MMTDFTSGKPSDAPVIRQMDVSVSVDIWDWDIGSLLQTIDITQSVLSFTWTKTMRTAMGGCTMSLTPVMLNSVGIPMHVFDMLHVMDVIKIKEFGVTKFQGYIRRIATNGSMGSDGKPQRTVVLTLTHIGGLLEEAQLGYQILALRIKELDSKLSGYMGAAAAMATAIANKMQGGGVLIKDIVSVLMTEWFKLLDALGATTYKKYLNTYLDLTTALDAFTGTRVLPSDVTFFYGSVENQNVWREIKKLAEAPFNEFYFDEGSHSVYVEGEDVALPKDKTCLVGRPTPFNGSIRSGAREDYFDNMDGKVIPLRYLTRYDFNVSTEQCYSVYLAVPEYSDFTEYSLFCMGSALVDDANLNKFLLRPMTMRIFYATVAQRTSAKVVSNVNDFVTEMTNAAQTLKNWYEKNVEYISGSISFMVPSSADDDVYLGDKVSMEGLDGSFYAEGVSHSWFYGGALTSSLSVTRGWDYSKKGPITFTDKIFTAGSFPTAGSL